MKTILQELILLLTISTICSAQVTFQKAYPDMPGDINQISEGEDGFYFTHFDGTQISNESWYLSKIDLYGELQWTKQIHAPIEIDNVQPQLVINKLGQYAIIENDESNDSLFSINLYDSNSELILTKSITHTQANHFSIYFGKDESLYVAYVDSIYTGNIWLTKISPLGDLLWSRIICPKQNSFIQTSTINELQNGELIFTYRRDLFKLSTNGEIIGSFHFSQPIQIVRTFETDQVLVKPSDNFIVSLSPDLEQQWSIETNLVSEIQVNGERFYTSYSHGGSVQEYSNDGAHLNTFSVNQDIYSLKTISDNRLIIGGWQYIGLKRTNCITICSRDGSIGKFIELYYPTVNTKLSTFDKIYIGWLSNQVDSIDLAYSTDGGSNWLIIDRTIPAKWNAYQWEGIYQNNFSLLFKVSESGNPSLFDVSDGPIEIRIYDEYNYISGNQIFMWVGNNGSSAHDPFDDESGMFWPGGDLATIPAIFADGIVWGGYVNGELSVNGSTYRSGLTPGAIKEDGTADEPTKSEYQVFKLKKDWQNLSTGLERFRMEYNYNNWPGNLGAPYTDVDKDGKFTRGTDLPKVLGDETLFYVANDLDSATTARTYGSKPVGIEFQQTLYAFNTPQLEDVVFKFIKIINKSKNTIEDMYLSYWADDDLGFAGDDFVGCDTLLNLGYTYNGDNNDDDNYRTPPPAIGRILLKGPVNDYDTLKMTSFIIGTKSSYTPDPYPGEYRGAVEFYNYMQGLFNDGRAITDIHSGDTTKYMVAGDPVTRTGWYEGDGWPDGPNPADRRSIMSSGPFDMMPGDSQTIAYAILLARGTDNINSVAKLKELAVYLHEFWGNDIPTNINDKTTKLPVSYSLAQNYPNPCLTGRQAFNPVTTIVYNIPAKTHRDLAYRQAGASQQFVKLIVYDILGRKVATLVNEVQPPGKYKVEFDGSALASGVYFYQLNAGQFVKTNKMILMK